MSEEQPEIEVQRPDTSGATRPFQPLADKAPMPSLDSEGVAVRSLSLVPPDVARVLLTLSGVLAPAAGFLPDYWNVVAAGLSLVLAALCGVAAPVPAFLAKRLPVSAAVVTLAGSSSLAVAGFAESLPDGWQRALPLVLAWGLSFVAGKPVSTSR